MRILHTADWHIGQLFHEYDRTHEHQQFLDWLVQTLKDESIDVLLLSGDVFDLSNPSAASVSMFYTFLNAATRTNPYLQIIITAGNHDSAARLESPKPLLESSNIHIIGVIERNEDGGFNYDKLILPLKDKKGNTKAWCLAVPFLRLGEYPTIPDCENPYVEGVSAFYKQAFAKACELKSDGQAIVAMGHLHAQNAEVTDLDKTERLIMGGVECISTSAFEEGIAYVALGHIHKAQRLGTREIRYCGSPLPMSFTERHYKHQVTVFDLENDRAVNVRGLEIPVSVQVQSVPLAHSALETVLDELSKLPDAEDHPELAPYLEVRVLLNQPEPSLRYKVEQALLGKNVRLATINVKYIVGDDKVSKQLDTQQQLDELEPDDIFSKVYELNYGTPVPSEMLQLFRQVTNEITQSQEE
jgi:exonuclease SbcD